MAQLPVIKQLQAQDFPTQQSWIGSLLYVLNLFLGSVYAALNNGLTIAQNSIGAVVPYTITTAAAAYYAGNPTTYATAGSASVVSFPWKFNTKPALVMLGQLTDISSSPKPVTSAVSIDWSYSSGVIIINSISGLTSTKTYSATFVVLGG